nr:hypothetical protein [Tanacetum cinerariifolium]
MITSLPPPPQQSTADPILVKRIGELEQHMANLLQYNLAMEERLDKHGSRLYKLENLNIAHQVSKAVDEIVTDAVDCMMQAPLQARFSGLPTKSLECDYSDQLLSDLEEACQKKRKRRDLPRTPSGSPPSQPPPPPPPAGTSGSPADVSGTQELSPTDSLIQDDSILDEQVHFSDDEDSENDHLPKADSRKDWWKPLPKEERPATPEPAWTIPSSNVSDVDWTNPKGDQVRVDVNRPLPLSGPPGHVTIQTQFFLNKDSEYLRYGSKGSSPALSISKRKAASYPDFGLELLVPEQMWIDDVCTYDISKKYGISHWWFNRQKFYIDRHDSPSRRKEVRSRMRILSVVKIKAYSRYGYDYLRKIVLRRDDLQEHTVAEKDFKNLYHSYEFKHDYTIIEYPRVVVFSVNNNERKIMQFNKIYKFSDDMLTRILEALAYRVKEFKIKRLNSVGFNPLVHSFRALSTLRCSSLRTASAAAKPCQGDSSEVYLITGIPTVAAAG